MTKIASARINSLPSPAMQANVPQSSESVLVLSKSQLSALITQAVQKAIQPLHDEVSHLKATVASQGEKIVALEATQDTLSENQLIQLNLINQIRRKKGPGNTERARAEKIEKYIVSRPDHKANYETLKGMLQVDNVRLNDAIKTLMATSEHAYSVQKETTGDKRKRILVMHPK